MGQPYRGRLLPSPSIHAPPRAPQKVKCPKHCTANAWMQVGQVKWGKRLKRHSGLKNAGMHEEHPLLKKECANVC